MADVDSTVTPAIPDGLIANLNEILALLMALEDLGSHIQEAMPDGHGITFGASVEALSQKAGIYLDGVMKQLGEDRSGGWIEPQGVSE